MKTRLLAGCALVALTASASNAADLGAGTDYYAPPASSSGAAGVFGDVHLSGIYFNGDGVDEFALEGGGVVVAPFGNGWNASVRGDVGYLFDAGEWTAVGSGHLFYLNQTWAAGAFVEGATTDIEDSVSVGGEAAAFVGNVDVVGSLGYGFATTDYWQAAATTNIYFTPNTAVTGAVGGTWFDSGDDAYVASLGLEHRFAATPVSLFGDVGYSNFASSDAVFVGGGARVVFGGAGNTLQDYNRANPF